MPIKLISSILCKKSSIDEETKLMSLFDVFDEISVQVDESKANNKSLDIRLPINYEIVCFFEKSENLSDSAISFDVKIELIQPSGNKVQSLIEKITLKKNINRHRHRFRIQGIAIHEEGKHAFNISLKTHDQSKFKVSSKLPLEIKIGKPQKK